MTKNMGFFDRVLRVSIALLVGIFYITGQISGLAAIILGVMSVIFIATSAVGTCPLYLPFGLSTRRGQSAEA